MLLYIDRYNKGNKLQSENNKEVRKREEDNGED